MCLDTLILKKSIYISWLNLAENKKNKENKENHNKDRDRKYDD